MPSWPVAEMAKLRDVTLPNGRPVTVCQHRMVVCHQCCCDFSFEYEEESDEDWDDYGIFGFDAGSFIPREVSLQTIAESHYGRLSLKRTADTNKSAPAPTTGPARQSNSADDGGVNLRPSPAAAAANESGPAQPSSVNPAKKSRKPKRPKKAKAKRPEVDVDDVKAQPGRAADAVAPPGPFSSAPAGNSTKFKKANKVSKDTGLKNQPSPTANVVRSAPPPAQSNGKVEWSEEVGGVEIPSGPAAKVAAPRESAPAKPTGPRAEDTDSTPTYPLLVLGAVIESSQVELLAQEEKEKKEKSRFGKPKAPKAKKPTKPTGDVIPRKFGLDLALPVPPPQEVFPRRRGVGAGANPGVERWINRDDEAEFLIYTDGACFDNGSPDARAGCAFVWKPAASSRADNEPARVVAFRLEDTGADGAEYVHTSNRAELRAVIAALRHRPWHDEEGGRFRGLVVATDSEYVVNGATNWARRWIRNGWRLSWGGRPVKNRDLWEALLLEVEALDALGFAVRFWRVPRQFNHEADRAAKGAAALFEPAARYGDVPGSRGR
ncbi:Ribonuclease H [Colletotrichum orbiculare MAFF 240422]|uniref:ribonuclease H n=1 Tax=Colletotrichum orbiculare (strain 104-T / ATCC 96160 / CBS 514.97 / LARS 414 / MAFF 240422) TaxID=1213857 RepID=N4V154_COLOR|nr:Ribonuclease H [Colletotrichum orbiculare MAFF 240422]